MRGDTQGKGGKGQKVDTEIDKQDCKRNKE